MLTLAGDRGAIERPGSVDFFSTHLFFSFFFFLVQKKKTNSFRRRPRPPAPSRELEFETLFTFL